MVDYFSNGKFKLKTHCDECGFKHQEGRNVGVFVPKEFLGGRYDVSAQHLIQKETGKKEGGGSSSTFNNNKNNGATMLSVKVLAQSGPSISRFLASVVLRDGER